MENGWVLLIVCAIVGYFVDLFLYRVVKINWSRYDLKQGYDGCLGTAITAIIIIIGIIVWLKLNRP